MKPTPGQLEQLKLSFRLHSEGYDSSVLYLKLAPLWCVSLLGFFLCYYMIEYSSTPGYGWFGAGMLCGINYVSVKSVWRYTKFWPVNDHVVDWERVDRLLRDNEPRLPPG